MHRLRLSVAVVVTGLVQTAHGQAASLILKSDLAGSFTVDGKPGGHVQAGVEARITLPPGEHALEVTPMNGAGKWAGTVVLKEPDTQAVDVPLKEVAARAETRQRGYWVDSATELMWAASDNAIGASWSQAVYYCQALAAGGYRDWRLPAIDELHSLFGGASDDNGHHVIGPLNVTGWAWSSTPGQDRGEQWALDFGDGARASAVTGDSGLNRALCVRSVSSHPKGSL